LAAFVIAIVVAVRSYLFLQEAITTHGEVLSSSVEVKTIPHVPAEDDIGQPYTGSVREDREYYCKVRYIHPQTRVEGTANIRVDRDYKSGDKVDILISPDSTQVSQDKFSNTWGPPLLLMVLAVILGALWSISSDVSHSQTENKSGQADG
jgi:hypothetical protein